MHLQLELFLSDIIKLPFSERFKDSAWTTCSEAPTALMSPPEIIKIAFLGILLGRVVSGLCMTISDQLNVQRGQFQIFL